MSELLAGSRGRQSGTWYELLTELLTRLATRVALIGVPREIVDLPMRSRGFFRDRQTDALSLMFAWMGVAFLATVAMVLTAGGYNIVTGHRSQAIVVFGSAPALFALVGAVLQFIRVEVDGILIRLPGRLAGRAATNGALRWLVTPRDGDLVVQVIGMIGAVVLVAMGLL